MVASNARKSAVGSQLATTRSAMDDFLDILAKQHPGLSKSALETTGRAVAALGAATGQLSRAQQRKIVAREKDLAKAMEQVVSVLASTKSPNPHLILLDINVPVEVSKGEGLGELLDSDEGRGRLAEYATPVRLEDWAGPIAGPKEIEREYGTKRSTLHEWQKRGAIISLLRGERKHVYPLAQFIDGRPIEGMSKITRIIANPRVAWFWLTRPNSTGDRKPPLERLKDGRVDEVVAAAKRDFDFV